MGIFDDFRAAKDVQNIKSGKTANLSIAQIVNLLINLPDASKNLSTDQFQRVSSLYNEYRNFKTKTPMDMDAYLTTSLKIVKSFNCIAFYGDYCGGNSEEFRFMMPELTHGTIEEIWKLQKEIAKDEASLSELSKTILDNHKIIQESFSDEDLNRMVSRGEFPASQVEAYVKERSNLELIVSTLAQGFTAQNNALEKKRALLSKLTTEYIENSYI